MCATDPSEPELRGNTPRITGPVHVFFSQVDVDEDFHIVEGNSYQTLTKKIPHRYRGANCNAYSKARQGQTPEGYWIPFETTVVVYR